MNWSLTHACLRQAAREIEADIGTCRAREFVHRKKALLYIRRAVLALGRAQRAAEEKR